jgi:hypothetical protein
MISLVGNYFLQGQNLKEESEILRKAEYQALCNYCDKATTVQQLYDYCYQCGCFLCADCRGDYQHVKRESLEVTIQR